MEQEIDENIASSASEDVFARRIGKALSPTRRSPRLSASSTPVPRSPLSPSNTKPMKRTPAKSVLNQLRSSPKVRQLSQRALTPIKKAVSLAMFSPAKTRVRALPAAHTPNKLHRSSSKRSLAPIPTRLWSHTVPSEFLTSITKQEIKRQEIIFELILTEELYGADLRLLAEVFENGMAQLASVNEADIDTIFGSLDQLIAIHDNFLIAFQERQQQDKAVECIGDVLLSKLDELHDYADYCGNMRRASLRLHSLMQEDEVVAFLEECYAKDECRRLGLSDFLDQPRRRLSKYGLLISEIARSTPDGHPDRENIVAAEAKMNQVAATIDLEAGIMDNQFRLQEIREAFENTNKSVPFQLSEALKQASIVVYEDRLRLPKSSQDVHGILLDSAFLLVREKEKNNSVAYRTIKEPIPLAQLSVADLSESHVETVHSDVKFALRLSHDGNKDISYIVAASSQTSKNDWLKTLTRAIVKTKAATAEEGQ